MEDSGSYANYVVREQQFRKQVEGLEDRISESVNTSLDKFQEYVDLRIAELTKAVEVGKNNKGEDSSKLVRSSIIPHPQVSNGKPSSSAGKGRTDRTEGKSTSKNTNKEADSEDVGSEITIYRPAINQITSDVNNGVDPSLRFSSSSDESPFEDSGNKGLNLDDKLTNKECFLGEEDRNSSYRREANVHQERPHASKNLNHGEERAARMIRDAEAAKQQILEVPGKDFLTPHIDKEQVRGSYVNSILADEDYQVVASHVDESIKQRIVNNEYVNFSQLIPHDKISQEEDHRMVMMHKADETFFMPAADRDTSGINSFYKWEQAFHVFSNIYLEQFPYKAAGLIQYNHVINTTALSYAWENVYRYDREFRIHISRHPERSWAVVLQQAWNLYIKDRAVMEHRKSQGYHNEGRPSGSKKGICFAYNLGNCQYGARCKFEHRCTFCGKWGHGAHVCRRALAKLPGGNSPWRDSDKHHRRSDRYHYYSEQKDKGQERRKEY